MFRLGVDAHVNRGPPVLPGHVYLRVQRVGRRGSLDFVQNSVITFQPLLALARLARVHFGHPVGLTRLVRWFIVALHVCSHVPHFHSAFLFDPFSTSVAFLSGSTYSPLSTRRGCWSGLTSTDPCTPSTR